MNAQLCAHCGRQDVGSYDRGYAMVSTYRAATGTLSAAYVCHPNDDGPDCYQLVTVHRHPMPCTCTIPDSL